MTLGVVTACFFVSLVAYSIPQKSYLNYGKEKEGACCR